MGDRRGGPLRSTIGGFSPGEDDLHEDYLRDLSDRLLAMIARRQACQQSLAVLAEEQEAFLEDMNAFAKLHGSASSDAMEASRVEQPEVASSSMELLRSEQPDVACSSAEQPEAGSSHAEQPEAASRHAEQPEAASRHAEQPEVASSSAEQPETARTNAHVSGETQQSFSPRHHETLPCTASPGDVLPLGDIKAVVFSSSEALASAESARMRADLQMAQGVMATILRNSGLGIPGGQASVPSRCRALADAVMSFKFFEPAMGIIILFNAAHIGWTIDKELRHEDTSVEETIEIILLSIFVAELVLRCLAQGFRYFRSAWNVFDFLLISWTCLVMLSRVLFNRQGTATTFSEIMEQMLLLRILRLLRLVRAMRFVQLCRPLWKLVKGLMNSVGTMASAFTLLFFTIYLFACFGAELISKPYKGDAKVGALVDKHFSGIPVIILTLCQFLSMDSTASLYVPLVTRSPLLGVYFMLMVLLVTIALMNLITAIVVDDAISTTQMDKEMSKHFLRARLREVRPAFAKLFHQIDTSENGTLEIQEVTDAFREGLQIPREISDMVNPGRVLDLFDLLDQDEDGELTESEFVDGLSCLAVSEVPLETMQMLHVLRSIRRGVLMMRAALEGSQTGAGQGFHDDLPSQTSPRAPIFKESGPLKRQRVNRRDTSERASTPRRRRTPAASQQQAHTRAGAPSEVVPALWFDLEGDLQL